MLYWGTVSSALNDVLIKLMRAEAMKDFRLVGGTALSLQIGHRMSVDIDLFTDAAYGTIDFNIIENFLKNEFVYAQGDFGAHAGIGKSYLVGDDVNSLVKLDIYYSMDPFFQPALQVNDVRFATIEEITAMKVDVIQRGGRKKDFWDIHELLSKFTIDYMIDLHKQRFEWTHNRELIIKNFIDFRQADHDFNPLCLRNKEWIYIKEDICDVVEKIPKL